MKFFAVAALFAATALAGDRPAFYHQGRPVSLEQAQNACGSNVKAACCNSKTADLSLDHAGGLLSLLTNPLAKGLGKYEGCSSLANLLGGDKSCQSVPTCCDGNNVHQSGLVPINANCVQIPISVL